MIIIDKKTIDDIPCLFVTKASDKTTPLPTVIYYHGFNGEKEASLTIAYKLAEQGFRVVLPDSLYHGERKGTISQAEKEMKFWEIVLSNIEELKLIKAFLQAENILLDGRLGLAGTSMGGITTSGALVKYDWVKVAGVLMGTPNIVNYAGLLIEQLNHAKPNTVTSDVSEALYKTLESIDLSKHPERINNRAILFWHGEQDEVIPISYVKDFTENNQSDNVRFIKEAKRMHHVSRLAVEETINWFKLNL